MSSLFRSSAKGIGRITNRLPLELADDVVGGAVDLLAPDEQASACALQFEMAAASQVCGLPRLPACARSTSGKNFGSQLSRLRRFELPRGAFRSVQRWRLALIMPCDAMRSPSQLKITHVHEP